MKNIENKKFIIIGFGICISLFLTIGFMTKTTKETKLEVIKENEEISEIKDDFEVPSIKITEETTESLEKQKEKIKADIKIEVQEVELPYKTIDNMPKVLKVEEEVIETNEDKK